MILDSTTPPKCCTKCGAEYPSTCEYFHKDKSRADGLFPWCKPCSRQHDKERLPRKLETQRERDRRNPEKKKAKAKLDRERHKDRIRIQQRDWEERNKEHVREKSRLKMQKHRREHPEKAKVTGALRRSREKNGSFTDEDVKLQFKTQKGMCWWCGGELDPKKYHVDHRIPLARGGTNWPDNICVSCPKCNLSKNDRMPWEWNGRLL